MKKKKMEICNVSCVTRKIREKKIIMISELLYEMNRFYSNKIYQDQYFTKKCLLY